MYKPRMLLHELLMLRVINTRIFLAHKLKSAFSFWMAEWEKVWFANSFKLDIFQAENGPKD